MCARFIHSVILAGHPPKWTGCANRAPKSSQSLLFSWIFAAGSLWILPSGSGPRHKPLEPLGLRQRLESSARRIAMVPPETSYAAIPGIGAGSQVSQYNCHQDTHQQITFSSVAGVGMAPLPPRYARTKLLRGGLSSAAAGARVGVGSTHLQVVPEADRASTFPSILKLIGRCPSIEKPLPGQSRGPQTSPVDPYRQPFTSLMT
jgi:hypothetical protein